jgi:hypothetical protein
MPQAFAIAMPPIGTATRLPYPTKSSRKISGLHAGATVLANLQVCINVSIYVSITDLF